jgi:hypothetical protein
LVEPKLFAASARPESGTITESNSGGNPVDRRELLKISAMLLGGAISGSCSRALESEQDLSTAPDDGPLNDADMAKVARLSELIIPRTDTPGAIDAGVPDFIHNIVANWYEPEEAHIFLTGLRTVDEVSRDKYGAAFVDVTGDQQTAVLQQLESELPADNSILAGGAGDSPFFVKLKELTVLGYYTSEVGSKQELVYIPMPGRYEGDALFDDLGRQWTLGY